MEAKLIDTDFEMADLRRARNIRVGQLKRAKILFECTDLDPELKQQLEKEKPCLFTENGCE